MKAIIIGAGTYGEVYLNYLKEANYNIIGFLDDNQKLWGSKVGDVDVIGGVKELNSLKSKGVEAVFCPLGNNHLRVQFLSLANSLGFQTPSYIHPSANISKNVKIGEGVYVLLGVNIMPDVMLEDFVMVSMGANIAHHSFLKKGTFISTGVNFGASITANEYTYVGIGATVMTGLKSLGRDCLIGAGAVVIKNVPNKAVVAGVPAKVLRIKE